MLVVAKEPHIKVELHGEGISNIIDVLTKAIPNLEVKPLTEFKDEYVDVFETKWFEKINNAHHKGITVRVRRENLGMTQKELSKKAEIPVSNISSIENGKRNIGLKTAQKLAFGLNCETKDFF